MTAAEPLSTVGIDIIVRWENVIRQTSLKKFKAHKSKATRSNSKNLSSFSFAALTPQVRSFRLFPGMDSATIKAFFTPPVKGVVLETFGAGNAPQRPDLREALQEAYERGVVVVAITQCAKGTVSDAYETGRKLLQTGVIPGVDMTPEVSSLSYGLALILPLNLF